MLLFSICIYFFVISNWPCACLPCACACSLNYTLLVVKRSITHLPQSVLRPIPGAWSVIWSVCRKKTLDFLLMFMFFVVDWSVRQIYGIPQGFLYQALCWRCDVSNKRDYCFNLSFWNDILFWPSLSLSVKFVGVLTLSKAFLPCRYSVVDFLDKNKDNLYQDFKRLLYNRCGSLVVDFSTSLACLINHSLQE